MIKIRKVSLEDLDRVLFLDNEVYDFPFTYERYRTAYEVDVFLGAYDDNNKLIGFTLAHTDPEKRKGLINGLVVDKDFRGRGIGDMLIEAVKQQLRMFKIPVVELTVKPNNSIAKKLYEKHGFKIESFDEDYFGQGQAREVMKCGLN